jgi:hypothetical protein
MGTCVAERTTFRGWDACILQNEYLRLIAVPAIGGRIMALDLGDYPFVFVDPALAGKLFTPEEHYGDGSLGAWKNYGGDKTWPAPQGWDNDTQWHGPPDPVLDSGVYVVSTFESDDEQARLVMTSAPDPRTGVQITRRFTVRSGASHVSVELSFFNPTARTLRWSIWDVMQLRAERCTPDGRLAYEPGCVITTPLNPNSVFPRGYNVMFGAQDNPQWQVDHEKGLVVVPYRWQIGKIGIDSPGDWIAFCNTAEGYAFTTHFQVQPNVEYPDGGATVEVWTVGAGKVGNLDYETSSIYLMETEVLSPLMSIPPGETVTMSLDWSLCRCDAPVMRASRIHAAVQPLEVEMLDDRRVRVQFRGGVFVPGMLRAVFTNPTGDELSDTPLGMTNPQQLAVVDCVLDVPSGAINLRLKLNEDDVGGETLPFSKEELP